MYDRLVDQVSCVDIRENKYIRVTDDLSSGSSLMLCCLGIDGKVKRERPVHDTALDLAAFVHLRQLLRLDRNLHLRIYHLYRGKGRNLGILNTAGLRDLYRIIDHRYLIL